MLNGLPEIPVVRVAVLAAISAGLIVVPAAATASAGPTTTEARGCPIAAAATPEHLHGVELFRPAGCF
ncbi:hypothetical protein P3T36_004748 [Kitasatospora sp. MAP12-15]|uniref:hypothetical protein n=1 Tax=unclassified Kitasatospora TaxID=2633591 RepID=UPI002473103A|nr:hypothetical protein [Kitasatospora sp. MAP12-44]MDH6110320.1 hypothetical protein [Kitasatospora sp. MAP12-44]